MVLQILHSASGSVYGDKGRLRSSDRLAAPAARAEIESAEDKHCKGVDMLCSPAYSDISFQYRADQGAVAKIDYEGYCLQHEYRTGIAGTDTGIEADVPSCIYEI